MFYRRGHVHCTHNMIHNNSLTLFFARECILTSAHSYAINAADSIGFAFFLRALIGFEGISIENTILNSNSVRWYAVLRDAYRLVSKYQIYITKLTFAYSYAGLQIFFSPFQMFANFSLKSIVDARAKYVKFYHKNHIHRTIHILFFIHDIGF